jgi:hypothetical protein
MVVYWTVCVLIARENLLTLDDGGFRFVASAAIVPREQNTFMPPPADQPRQTAHTVCQCRFHAC